MCRFTYVFVALNEVFKNSQASRNYQKFNFFAAFDIVSSDHSTFNKKQRALGVKDFDNIPQGVNGVGERMMILWEKLVHSGKSTPQQFVALTSANAAKLFNLYPDKGRLEIGSQVNIYVIQNDMCSLD